MNYDNYLNFLNTLSKEDRIKKEFNIFKLAQDKIIPEKQITKKEISIRKAIIRVKLENGKNLLIEDMPINFLISHSILIGDKTKLYEFELKKENKIEEDKIYQKYIADKNTIEKIKDEINMQTIIDTNPKKLFKTKFTYDFKQAKIIRKLKKFTNENKKIDLNSIHITPSDKVENFLPTIKKEHFELAKKIKIPLTNIIKDNLLIDSTTNIFNEENIIQIINPIKVSKEKVLWDFKTTIDPKTNKKVLEHKIYKDLKNELYVHINSKEIIEKLSKVKKVNFNFEKLQEAILKIKKIRLSSSKSETIIPLFKSIKDQKYVEIENTLQFKEITGVDFKLKKTFLEKTYIQTLTGEKAVFIDKYLNPKIENITEDLDKKQTLKFKIPQELVLKVINNQEIPIKELRYLEDINKNEINELIKILKYSIKLSILASINHNKIPIETIAKTTLEKYYASTATTLLEEIKKYRKYPSKKTLLKNTIKNLRFLIESTKIQKLTSKENFFILQTNLLGIEILKTFDSKNAQKMLNIIESYFKEKTPNIKKTIKNIELEELVKAINLANKIAKNNDTYIYLKKEIPKDLLSKSINILKENPTFEPKINLKIKKIKELLPYSYKEAIKEMRKLNFKQINDKNASIKIKNKEIKIKKEFFSIFEEHKDYKQISNNKYFKLLVKTSNTSGNQKT